MKVRGLADGTADIGDHVRGTHGPELRADVDPSGRRVERIPSGLFDYDAGGTHRDEEGAEDEYVGLGLAALDLSKGVAVQSEEVSELLLGKLQLASAGQCAKP